MTKKRINRREFLASTATAAGIIVPGVAWSASRPCPPPGLGVSGGTTETTVCSRTGPGQLPKLTLMSRAANGAHAWTFGHVFRQGDVPSGFTVTAGSDAIQMDVRNRWPDGSLKFAVLSGVTTLVRNSPKPIALGVSAEGDRSATQNVPEPASLDVKLTFGGAVTGTYTLQSALGVNKEVWESRSRAGRVRKILGPIMSEYHYYVPTSDDHLAVWFYVRCYANGATEIETVVENGWVLVPAPGQRDYTVALSVAGTTRYSGTVSHLHHARWSRVDWVGTDPQILPAHDGVYIKGTRLVPNYASGYGAPDDALWSNYTQSAAPMELGDWRSAWDATGDGNHNQIGLLPPWDVMCLQTSDSRAYAALVANARCAGSLSVHYRDENTGRPFRFANCAAQSPGRNGMPRATGNFLGGLSESTDMASHSAGCGYIPYLITGRWTALEEVQFWAGRQFFDRGTEPRGGALGLWHIWNSDDYQAQTRSLAWGMRQLALASTVVPDDGASADTALRVDYVRSIDANLNAIWRSSIQRGATHENSIGVIRTRNVYSSSGEPFKDSPWQLDFLTCVLGWITDLEVTTAVELAPIRDQLYKFAVGRAGGYDGGYNWRNISSYNTYYASNTPASSATFYRTFAEMYAATITTPPDTGDTLVEPNTSREIDAGRLTYGYAGMVLASLAFAADHGASGAREALARVRGSSTWRKHSLEYRNYAKWAVVPRES